MNDILLKLKKDNLTSKSKYLRSTLIFVFAVFAIFAVEQTYAQSCGSGLVKGSDGSCVREVKFHSKVNLTLDQAKSIAAQNGWELASVEQVKEAWQKAKLNVFAYGRTSSGDMCVPIQSPNGNFKKDPNCYKSGGNQGFFYVTPTSNCDAGFIGGNDGSCVREVKFYKKGALTLDQAKNLAAQNGWELASQQQVTEAWQKAKLNVFAYGRTSSGNMCVPIQSPNGNFQKGTNCGDNRGNQGFFYIENGGGGEVSSTNRSTTVPRFVPISDADTREVMKWIALKVSAVRVPYCYKRSETRGAGIPLSGKCEAGLEEDAGLCYQKCKAGYKGFATTCTANCPAGFTDIGLFCQKPSGTYGRGAGHLSAKTCENKNSVGSGGCEKAGLLWYPKCKAGYKTTTVNICAPVCPSGYADTGTGCRKPTYDRGVGKPFACPPGLQEGRESERSGLLCYPTCKNKDYEGVGPVCWQQCPSQQPVGCGFGCSTDKGTCASVTSSQVISPIMAAVSIATLGSALAASNAAKAAKAGKDVTKFTAGARKFTKLLKIINKLKRLKVMAKLSTMQAVGGPANMKKLIDAGKVIQIGYKFYVVTSTLKEQHDLFKKEFSKQFAEQTSPEIAVEIERRFGPKGAEYIRQEWADKHLSMMVEADAWATSKNVLTVAGIADPTGLVSVVNAYLHPVCKESAVFPNITYLSRD